MFAGFFLELKRARVPVSLKEYLTLLEAMEKSVAQYSVETFYYLARACLVKQIEIPRRRIFAFRSRRR